jgi:hypothetical protein
MKKPSPPSQNENEGIPIAPQTNGALASSFSLTEKSIVRHCRGRLSRRAQTNRYPDSRLQTLFPPSRSQEQWPWKFVTSHSGATVLDSHEVPCVCCVTTGVFTPAFQRAVLLRSTSCTLATLFCGWGVPGLLLIRTASTLLSGFEALLKPPSRFQKLNRCRAYPKSGM